MLAIKKDNKYLTRFTTNNEVNLTSNKNFAYVYNTIEEVKEIINTLENKEEYQIEDLKTNEIIEIKEDTKKELLTNTINYLQNNDQNGTYTDILTEVNSNELSIEEGLTECKEVLQRWKNEELSIEDTRERKEIQNIINTITVEY